MSFYSILDENKIKYKRNIDTSCISSIRAGGYADAIIYPSTEQELILTVHLLRKNGIAYKPIGGCTNTFFTDNGYCGVIISMRCLGDTVFSDRTVSAGAGMSLARLLSDSAKRGLNICPSLFGIPGSLGGAVRNNSGAFGNEISDVLSTARLYDPASEKIITLAAADMNFSYRDSLLKTSELLLLSCTLFAERSSEQWIRGRFERVLGERRASQPSEPSLGSFFKKGDNCPASKMIDELGLKGIRIGDAAVSLKHAGFIINMGKASASDICRLADFIKSEVYKERGILLFQEAEYVS